MADHPDIEALSARAEECWDDIQSLMTRRGAIQTRRDDLDGRRTRLLELQERLSPAFVSEPLTELLHRYAGDVPVTLELLNPEPHRDAVFTAIQPGTRTAARKPQALLRRARPHPQHVRHLVPRRDPQRQRRFRRARPRLRGAVPPHRRTRAAGGLRADDAARHRTGAGRDPHAAPGGRAGNPADQRTDRPGQHRAGRRGVQPRHPADAAGHPAQLPAVAELTDIVKAISRRIAEVGLGDKQAILDQYADILRLRNRLASPPRRRTRPGRATPSMCATGSRSTARSGMSAPTSSSARTAMPVTTPAASRRS